MLEFISKLRDEAVNNFRAIELTQSGGNVKAKVATHRTQYNLANLLLQLPRAVKEAEEAQLHVVKKAQAFKDSQEGGSI